jgi:hypothetical protein
MHTEDAREATRAVLEKARAVFKGADISGRDHHASPIR